MYTGVGTGATPVTCGGAGVLGLGLTKPGVGLGCMVGGSGQEAILQHVGSLGSGIRVQPVGTDVYLAHLENSTRLMTVIMACHTHRWKNINYYSQRILIFLQYTVRVTMFFKQVKLSLVNKNFIPDLPLK